MPTTAIVNIGTIVSGDLEQGVLEGDAVLIDGEVCCLRSRNTPAAARMAVVKRAPD